jgi:hypothetical protein
MKATPSPSATSLVETYFPLKSDFSTGAWRSSDVTWRAGMPDIHRRCQRPLGFPPRPGAVPL